MIPPNRIRYLYCIVNFYINKNFICSPFLFFEVCENPLDGGMDWIHFAYMGHSNPGQSEKTTNNYKIILEDEALECLDVFINI